MSKLSSEKPLYLIGASVRACAASLRRSPVGASYQIKTCDLFADADLQSVADASICKAVDYPQGLGDWLNREAPGYVIYTGGIENHPELIETVATRHELLGCNTAIVRKCRDPFLLAATLAQQGIATAKIQTQRPKSGRWLEKPIASCAGFNIRQFPTEAKRESAVSPTDSDQYDEAARTDCYFQERIDGRATAGLYVSDGKSTRLMGITHGLTVADLPIYNQLKLPPFLYAGSIGPVATTQHETAEWLRLGEIATDAFDLLGVFGIDAIVDPASDIVPIEINPRFTASMELIDIAWNTSVAQQHIDAYCGVNHPVNHEPCENATMAKLIVYANSPTHISRTLHRELLDGSSFSSTGIQIADVPVAGSEIPPGSPICTLLVPSGQMPDVLDEYVDAANQQVKDALHFFSQQSEID
ncbi:MAG: ATP-grasp domain-containing protein [Planctomycetota bacterium]